ncbi:3680_t:CDS:2 [Acaulospora colombiana]|uniref:3680_t:CDS:1 n=1 Tax=Acaulospora colombiana TaxID=27376 RepID=A0ACA9LC12_9GLOM|nr:3680_t:CDS:2 [Acaulospora colombiana]
MTIITYDGTSLFDMDNHGAGITGTVTCRALSPDPLLIVNGKLRLSIREQDRVASRNMTYNINYSPPIYNETTSLHATVYDCSENEDEFEYVDADKDVEEGEASEPRIAIGRGILHIKPSDFSKELKMLRGNRFGSLMYPEKFSPHFYRQRPEHQSWLLNEEGVGIMLHRYQGGNKGPVHGAAISRDICDESIDVKNGDREIEKYEKIADCYGSITT